jgi:ABC-2 type transport system ATP-binding protein
VSKRFGHTLALHQVTFTVPYGTIFGFLGPNGAGKTTTIRCLMDFIRPTSGSLSILGFDAQHDSAELKRRIGYLSSDSQLNLNWTGQEHIDFFANIKGPSAYQPALINRLGLDTASKVKALSSGNKQKLSIVLCFAGNPDLLIMDEPTRGLDPLLQNELYDILLHFIDERKTVFLSSHNLGEVERICNSVLLIKDGVIVEEKTMDDIRDLKVHLLSATARTAFDIKRLRALPNVTLLESSPKRISFKAKGDLNEVLRLLTQHDITDISITHVSLEDVFMEQYRSK